MRLAYVWMFLLSLVPVSATGDLNWLESFAYHCQRGSLGRTGDALVDFRQKTPPELHQPESPQGTFELENDIQELFRTAPEFRDIDGFRSKWNLSEEIALDILTYYGTRVYHDSAEIAGNVRSILARLQTVSRDHYLGDHRNEYQTHYLFYAINLTKLSVPEMARLRGVSEGQVYQELSRLGLSIRDAFAPHLPEIRRRHGAGESIDQIAAALGLGPEALEFYMHHEGLENRGVGWERLLAYRGGMAWETLVLIDLFEKGLTHQEIATELNRLSGGSDLRTESSVSHRLQELGLAQSRTPTAPASLFIPGYGLVKESGKLNPPLARQFIFDHYRMNDAWLADQLGVNPSSLQQFFERHHIVRRNGRIRLAHGAETQTQLDQYQRQHLVVRRILDWVREHGKVPIQSDFGLGAGQVGISYETFFSGPTAAFASRIEAIRALKVAGQGEGITIRFLDFKWHEFPDAIRSELQHEAVAMVISWMQAHEGKLPKTPDFHGTNGIKVGYDQLYARDQYGPGKRYYMNRIFDSYANAARAIKKAAQEAGMSLRYRDFYWDPLPNDIRLEIQKEIIAEIVTWMKAHDGRIPISSDYGGAPTNISVGYAQLPQYFDSREAMFVQLKATAEAEGMTVRILDVTWDQGIPPSLLPDARMEALTELVDWIAHHNGALPTNNDFGKRAPGKLSFRRERLIGIAPFGLYHSPSEAFLAIKKAASERNIQVRLLNVKWIGSFSEQVRLELQREAIAEILVWVRANGNRLPGYRDFNSKAGGIAISAPRLFGLTDYAVGKPNAGLRIFDTTAVAYEAVRRAAAAEGIEIAP